MEKRVLWLQCGNHRMPELDRALDTMNASGYLLAPETEWVAGLVKVPLHSDGVRTKILLPSVTITCSLPQLLLYPFLPRAAQNT